MVGALRNKATICSPKITVVRESSGMEQEKKERERERESKFKQYPLDANLSSGLLSTVTFGPVTRMLPLAHPLSILFLGDNNIKLSVAIETREWCENQSKGDYVNVVELLSK